MKLLYMQITFSQSAMALNHGATSVLQPAGHIPYFPARSLLFQVCINPTLMSCFTTREPQLMFFSLQRNLLGVHLLKPCHSKMKWNSFTARSPLSWVRRAGFSRLQILILLQPIFSNMVAGGS